MHTIAVIMLRYNNDRPPIHIS